jgi:hypothetical protein
MTTMTARYGRPKGSGLDDSRQLASVAALLVANPNLNPTAAIRSLGIEDPSVIRRLRDKFRMEETKLMSDARRAPRAGISTRPRPVPALAGVHHAIGTARAAVVPPGQSIPETRSKAPEPMLLATWFDLGLRAVATVVDQQAALAQHWYRVPAVNMALRNQLAINAYVIAMCAHGKPRRSHLH